MNANRPEARRAASTAARTSGCSALPNAISPVCDDPAASGGTEPGGVGLSSGSESSEESDSTTVAVPAPSVGGGVGGEPAMSSVVIASSCDAVLETREREPFGTQASAASARW